MENFVKAKKEKLTKTTVMLPETLLKEALSVTGTGITQTLRAALELLAAKKTYEKMIKLKGTYKSSLDLATLRED
jgi:hypothetical protein